MTVRTAARSSAKVLAAALAVMATGLAGCAGNRNMQAQADFADNYTERHPIAIGDVSKSIDVFLAPNSGLDPRQKEDVAEFVKAYRQNGKGALVMTLPPGAPPAAVQHTVAQIRAVAGSTGLAGGQIRTVSGPTHPGAASVRLTYSALDAKVAGQCGQWPHDLAGGATTQGWTNKAYYNHGCAYQTMMAAQVADPVDHVRARPDEGGDIGKRLHDIKSIREGKDPSTAWKTESDKINKAF